MPKGSSLRKGRISLPGFTYAITKRCHRSSSQIISDPHRPDSSTDKVAVLVGSLKWMHERGRARCFGYVVMPDHLHVLLQLGSEMSLSDTMRCFASFTSRLINKQNGRTGSFWQEGFYDRAMRNGAEHERHLEYFADNPVRRGYVSCPDDWPFTEILPDWSRESAPLVGGCYSTRSFLQDSARKSPT